MLESEVGQIFNSWSEVDYIGYKSTTKDVDWCSIIRQKINNLYTKYFDEEVILTKEYMDLLKTPYNLYYRWIKGIEINAEELTNVIENSIHRAAELKSVYQQQKMKKSWDEYKVIIENFLIKIFNNCRPIEDYEIENLTNKYIYELANEDNSYVSYFCNSLGSYMLNYQKEYYHLKRGRNKRYKRCNGCGNLIEITGNRKNYCNECAKKRKIKSNKISDKKYKNKMRENRNLTTQL